MDLSTSGGLIVGVLLIAMAIALASNTPLIFVDPVSLIIVLGGTFSAAFISLPASLVKNFTNISKNAFRSQEENPAQLIETLVSYAEIARRDGILALEAHTGDIEDDFLLKGIQLAVDGTDPEIIQQTLTTELEYIETRHENGKLIYDILGKYAPAFGLIGTLIGLVAMLAQLDDPSTIGAGMAVALITTLYGAILANLVFMPLADKLDAKSKTESLQKEIVIRGVMSIQSGDNPRIVAQKLQIFLPPTARAEQEAPA
mgnify:CR=1 FL=1